MRLAWLTMALTGLLLAQVPPVEGTDAQTVRKLLASKDPARLAWGAELAARSGQAEFAPDLRRLLGSANDRVKEQALDALIRLKAKVPPEELAPLLPRFRAQVIILAKANGNRDILLSQLRENQPRDPTWVALNESLLQIGGGRTYWSALLGEWTIHARIYVTDAGRTPVVGPQTGGAECIDGMLDDRAGFPASCAYFFFLTPRPGDSVLNETPHPVFYRRRYTGCDIRIDRDDYRGDFVASLENLETPVKGHMRFDVVWLNDDAYRAEVNRLRAGMLAEFQQILDWMVKRGLLLPEDAAMKPHIAVGIEDQRLSKAHELPATRPWE